MQASHKQQLVLHSSYSYCLAVTYFPLHQLTTKKSKRRHKAHTTPNASNVVLFASLTDVESNAWSGGDGGRNSASQQVGPGRAGWGKKWFSYGGEGDIIRKGEEGGSLKSRTNDLVVI